MRASVAASTQGALIWQATASRQGTPIKRRGKRRGQALRHTRADAQAGKCARPLRIHNRAQIRSRNAGLNKQRTDLRQILLLLPIARFNVVQ